MAVRYCDCEKWENSWPEIESAQTLAWSHGTNYTGDIFEFCPWCGEELKRIEEDEDQQ